MLRRIWRTWVDTEGFDHPTSLFAASLAEVGLVVRDTPDAPGSCAGNRAEMVVRESLQGCNGSGVTTSVIAMRDLAN